MAQRCKVNNNLNKIGAFDFKTGKYQQYLHSAQPRITGTAPFIRTAWSRSIFPMKYIRRRG